MSFHTFVAQNQTELSQYNQPLNPNSQERTNSAVVFSALHERGSEVSSTQQIACLYLSYIEVGIMRIIISLAF